MHRPLELALACAEQAPGTLRAMATSRSINSLRRTSSISVLLRSTLRRFLARGIRLNRTATPLASTATSAAATASERPPSTPSLTRRTDDAACGFTSEDELDVSPRWARARVTLARITPTLCNRGRPTSPLALPDLAAMIASQPHSANLPRPTASEREPPGFQLIDRRARRTDLRIRPAANVIDFWHPRALRCI